MKTNKLILARPPCRKTFTLHWDFHTTHTVVMMTKKSDIFYSLGHFHDISVTGYLTVNATLPPALSLPPISLSLSFPSHLLSLSLCLTSIFSHTLFFSISSTLPSLYISSPLYLSISLSFRVAFKMFDHVLENITEIMFYLDFLSLTIQITDGTCSFYRIFKNFSYHIY